MKTLIKPKLKLKIVSTHNSAYKVQEKLINSRIGLDHKFYQKLIVIFLASSTFLIFPETPKESEVLCNKYYSKEICDVW